ncbi:MAG: hypothetical protein ACI8Y7_000504 [Candidatus Woesearchaeota archaeon]|jgi:hypothetical protein
MKRSFAKNIAIGLATLVMAATPMKAEDLTFEKGILINAPVTGISHNQTNEYVSANNGALDIDIDLTESSNPHFNNPSIEGNTTDLGSLPTANERLLSTDAGKVYRVKFNSITDPQQILQTYDFPGSTHLSVTASLGDYAYVLDTKSPTQADIYKLDLTTGTKTQTGTFDSSAFGQVTGADAYTTEKGNDRITVCNDGELIVPGNVSDIDTSGNIKHNYTITSGGSFFKDVAWNSVDEELKLYEAQKLKIGDDEFGAVRRYAATRPADNTVDPMRLIFNPNRTITMTNTEPGLTYDIQRSSDLTTWTPYTKVLSNGASITFNPDMTGPATFYRGKKPPQ